MERADITRSAVLALLGRHGPMSRAAMARKLGLSAAAVGLVTKRLIVQGWVEELDRSPSTGGRPGQLLGLVGSAGRAIGAKVAFSQLTMVDMRLDGTVTSSSIEDFDAASELAVAHLGSRLQAFVGQSTTPLLGVGVCVPGIVDHADVGTVIAPALGWEKVALGRHLRGVLGVPVLVENGVKALALAESLYGRGRTLDNFSVLTIGRGVGFAYVADGAVHRGARGSAGEIGHCVVDPKGPLCWCGRRGCLEAFAGEEGLVEAGRRRGAIGPRTGLAGLVSRADRGDDKALDTFRSAAEHVGRFIAATIGVLDPEVILVAGEGSAYWRHWEAPFLRALRAYAPDWSGSTAVRVGSWDDTAWAQGAAALVLAGQFDEGPLGRKPPEHESVLDAAL